MQKLEGEKGVLKEGVRKGKREEAGAEWRTRCCGGPEVCAPRLSQLDWQEKRSEQRESGRKRAEKR